MSPPPEERPPERPTEPPVEPIDEEVDPSFGRDTAPLFEPGRAPVRGHGVPTWKKVLAGAALVGLVVAGWVGPSALLGHLGSAAKPPTRPAPGPRARPARPPPVDGTARIHVEPFENVGGEAVLAHLERALADATALALQQQGLELSLDERLRSRSPFASHERTAHMNPDARATLVGTTGAAWLAAGRFERRGDAIVASVTFQALTGAGAGLTVGVDRPNERDDELPEALAEAVGLLAPALVAPPRR